MIPIIRLKSSRLLYRKIIFVLLVALGVCFECASQSNTVPVFYISTVNAQPIIDKENYVDGTYYVTVPKRSEFAPVASSDNPASLKIRGRGNATWKMPKKPYKLKLAVKTELLGMPAQRHFALLACYGAAFELGLFSYMAGLKIAEMTGQPWVPRCEPVELVLNGEFQGLYLLIETVRVDENRVNIFKQPDNCTDPEVIQGGWLVEIDNYPDENQIIIPEYVSTDSIGEMRLTYKNPEKLSVLQENWLRAEFTRINRMTNPGDRINNNWANYIDATSLARYFIVREMLHDTDGYNGSFYLHKDLGENTKWICGPMWDLAAPTQKKDWVMNDHPGFSWVHYIPYVVQTTAFQRALAEEWSKFMPRIRELIDYVNSLYQYHAADRANGMLWNRPADAYNKVLILRAYLYENAQWIDANIVPAEEIAEDTFQITIDGRTLYFDITARNFRILTLSGKTIKSGTNTDRCDLSGLAPGVYFIRAESEDNESAIKKFVLR